MSLQAVRPMSAQARIVTGFRAYLRDLPAQDSPEAAFIAAAKANPSFPDVASWAELRQYLRHTGTLDDDAPAARRLWQQYHRAQRASGD